MPPLTQMLLTRTSNMKKLEKGKGLVNTFLNQRSHESQQAKNGDTKEERGEGGGKNVISWAGQQACHQYSLYELSLTS